MIPAELKKRFDQDCEMLRSPQPQKAVEIHRFASDAPKAKTTVPEHAFILATYMEPSGAMHHHVLWPGLKGLLSEIPVYKRNTRDEFLSIVHHEFDGWPGNQTLHVFSSLKAGSNQWRIWFDVVADSHEEPGCIDGTWQFHISGMPWQPICPGINEIVWVDNNSWRFGINQIGDGCRHAFEAVIWIGPQGDEDPEDGMWYGGRDPAESGFLSNITPDGPGALGEEVMEEIRYAGKEDPYAPWNEPENSGAAGGKDRFRRIQPPPAFEWTMRDGREALHTREITLRNNRHRRQWFGFYRLRKEALLAFQDGGGKIYYSDNLRAHSPGAGYSTSPVGRDRHYLKGAGYGGYAGQHRETPLSRLGHLTEDPYLEFLAMELAYNTMARCTPGYYGANEMTGRAKGRELWTFFECYHSVKDSQFLFIKQTAPEILDFVNDLVLGDMARRWQGDKALGDPSHRPYAGLGEGHDPFDSMHCGHLASLAFCSTLPLSMPARELLFNWAARAQELYIAQWDAGEVHRWVSVQEPSNRKSPYGPFRDGTGPWNLALCQVRLDGFQDRDDQLDSMITLMREDTIRHVAVDCFGTEYPRSLYQKGHWNFAPRRFERPN